MVESLGPPTTLRVLGGKHTTSGDTCGITAEQPKLLEDFSRPILPLGQPGCRVAEWGPAGGTLARDRPNSAPLAPIKTRSTDSGGLRAQLPNGMRLGRVAS